MNPRSKKAVSDPEEKQAAAEGAVQRKRNEKAERAFFRVANVIVFITAAALLLSSFLFPFMLISGDSMEPGLNDGDLLVLFKTRNIHSGDLLGFNWNDKTLLKRVIACPGDWVMIDSTGRVYINGTLLDEPYVSEYRLGVSDVKYPLQVPVNSYFVMGDERISSLDSRSSLVGCIEYDQIIGKGIVCIWPLHKQCIYK